MMLLKKNYRNKSVSACFMLLLAFTFITGCRKDMLNEKPDKSLVVPTTLEDMQALLNNTSVFGTSASSSSEIGAGDYYLDLSTWQSLYSVVEKNAYVWNSEIYEGSSSSEWTRGYEQVFYANTVLEGLEKLGEEASIVNGRKVRGEALFYRAFAFFDLATMFAAPYQGNNAEEFGIPLRYTTDINAVTPRASLQESYSRIIGDLEASIDLLPNRVSVKTTPNKTAARALLVRVLMAIGNYEKASDYASLCLNDQPMLLDFNQLDSTANYPFSIFNEEVILHKSISNYTGYRRPNGKIDSMLVADYGENDLRKALFFILNDDGSSSFRGNYTGSLALFGGLAWDEVYLNQAECLTRLGDFSGGLNYLNKLLSTRWKSGSFVPVDGETADEVLRLILKERRKSLLMRGIRWGDLRRLNQEETHKTTLIRQLGGETYTLPPGDPRYVWPIPDEVIRLTGIEQNQR